MVMNSTFATERPAVRVPSPPRMLSEIQRFLWDVFPGHEQILSDTSRPGRSLRSKPSVRVIWTMRGTRTGKRCRHSSPRSAPPDRTPIADPLDLVPRQHATALHGVQGGGVSVASLNQMTGTTTLGGSVVVSPAWVP